MPQPIIKISDMSIIYNHGKDNEFKASDNINMEIYPEEYIIFFGPSGCGKSTTLYSILGVLAPTMGTVEVKGQNIYAYSPEELVKFQTKTIGIVYQSFFLISSLTVADNVSLPQIFQGIHPDERRKRSVELLHRFGIEKQADKLPDALSGGQSQRVAVARAFVNDPDILLADEPVGNLDSFSADAVMGTLEEINQKDHKTIILVTHDAKYLPYAHRVFYMRDGHVVRIVPNPEKKQMAKIDKQKTLVTEFEQLAKIHPYLSPIELKVKSVINYLTQDFTFDQLQRLESAVKLMVERKIKKDVFYDILIKKFSEGGVEFSQSLAKVMSEKVDTILKQSDDVRRYRRRLEQNVFFSKEEVIIQRLTSYLLTQYKGTITPFQTRRLREAVYERVAGIIRREPFEERLVRSLEDGGAGFAPKVGRELTTYFEKLLIQGLDLDYEQSH
jgi:putative ABC transport system ATP-binding protein